MSERFSQRVLDILRAAGWFEGRNARGIDAAGSDQTLFPKAKESLMEFGGLHIGTCGPGMELATSDVEIDPKLTAHLTPELTEFEKKVGTRLYALGEVHRGHGYLVIDQEGRIYLLSDELTPYTTTLSQALECLLLGKKPRDKWCQFSIPANSRPEQGPK
jgi:SUKH-3 immunity protein